MLYDDEVLRGVAEARKLGLTGAALRRKVYERFEGRLATTIQANALADAFAKLIDKPAAKAAAKAKTDQPKLFV